MQHEDKRLSGWLLDMAMAGGRRWRVAHDSRLFHRGQQANPGGRASMDEWESLFEWVRRVQLFLSRSGLRIAFV